MCEAHPRYMSVLMPIAKSAICFLYFRKFGFVVLTAFYIYTPLVLDALSCFRLQDHIYDLSPVARLKRTSSVVDKNKLSPRFVQATVDTRVSGTQTEPLAQVQNACKLRRTAVTATKPVLLDTKHTQNSRFSVLINES